METEGNGRKVFGEDKGRGQRWGFVGTEGTEVGGAEEIITLKPLNFLETRVLRLPPISFFAEEEKEATK